jgi:hypothetical protein
MDHSIMCKCGTREASFNFKNEIMPTQTIEELYCPVCSQGAPFNPEAMIRDNGWVIRYDMDIARLYSSKLPASDREKLSPELLFDEGYITWRGVYPGDHIDSAREREELATLAKVNPKKYFEEMRSWAISRMTKLKNEGWRKAYEG